jgi:hypothetical protein
MEDFSTHRKVSAPATDRVVARRFVLVVAVCAAVSIATGCERPAAPPIAEPSPTTAEAPEVAPAAHDEAEVLAGAPRPDVAADPQPCAADEDCRVWKPGDWSADAACCYVYPCAIDYFAISSASRERLRRWERANPFDCVEHIRTNGSCAPRGPQCGLSQEPPQAVCSDGACALRYPEPWPVIDPEAQTCTTANDCVVWRRSDAVLDNLCCADGCGRDFVPVRRSTLDEINVWLESRRSECVEWRVENRCIDRRCAPFLLPRPVCAAGVCRIERDR